MARLRREDPEGVRASKKKSYLLNREKILAKDKRYRERNRESVLRRALVYHHANSELVNAGRRKRYHDRNEASILRAKRAATPEHQSNIRKIYRKSNPLKLRIWDACKRAKRRMAEGRFAISDVERLHEMQAGLCFWCYREVGHRFDIDHVFPLSRGGTNWPDNIVIACPTCNQRKHNMMPTEWLERLALEGIR